MKELFADSTAGLIGLLFFFGIFVCILIWVFRPGSGKKYDHAKNIPLEEEEEVDRNGQ